METLRWLLSPLAPLYGLTVWARNRAFDRHPQRAVRVDVPVISIGNLTTGGTGKTPLTLFLAQSLEAAGLNATILSRGYGGRRAIDPMDVEPNGHPRETGDEPMMMARRLGPGRVIVARKRLVGALRALAKTPRPDLLLLDDGFQHRALHRDIDLLLLDGVRTWGNGHMLPFGDLREPMPSAARAHALVVTRGSRANRPRIEAWWAEHGSGGPVFFVDFAVSALRDAATGRLIQTPVPELPLLFPFCALGHPEAFFADLLVAGMRWNDFRHFRDHRALTPRHLRQLSAAAASLGAGALVCTEKDAVKMGRAHLQACTLPLWVAEQRVDHGEGLLAFLQQRLQALPRQPATT